MVAELYSKVYSFENLLLAFKKARKGKTTKGYVLEFEKNLKENLLQLQSELLFHAYQPKPLQTFVIRDPKTRKISKSAFRDRIIHHALCNIIEPLFEKCFIYDSFANRRGKGICKAIGRFNEFQRAVSKNHSQKAFVLKADIKKYFDNVDHAILLNILNKKLKDPKIMWLIKTILSNYKTSDSKGMPLENLTSQFFANVFLNELDQFVKHKLLAKYYIRHVDDFVIMSYSPKILNHFMGEIGSFLLENLSLKLHPDKTKIIPLANGIEFLGLRIFPHYMLIKAKNLRKFYRKLNTFYSGYEEGRTNYDSIYNSLEGWHAYAKNANTYKLRKKIMLDVESRFMHEVSAKEVNRLRKTNKS